MAIGLGRTLAYTPRVGRGVGRALAGNTGGPAVCRCQAESACRDIGGEGKGRGILDVYLLVLSIHFCF